MMMKKMLTLLAACALLTGVAAEKKNAYTDIKPTAVVGEVKAADWQVKNRAAIDAAVKPEVLAALVANDEAVRALLAKVQGAYVSDPLVMIQIATISQEVMRPCKPLACARDRWIKALLKASETAPDAYRKMFFLDQLRWCARPCDAKAVTALAAAATDKAVRDFAEQVARELAAACAHQACPKAKKNCQKACSKKCPQK